MSNSLQIRSILVVGTIIGILWSSFSYVMSNVGTWAFGGGSPYDCRETAGSGADDEVVLLFLWVLIVPALVRIARFAKPMHWAERVVFFLLSLLVALFMLVATGCADLVFTAKYTGQPGLLAAPVFWLLATLLYVLPNPRRYG